MKTTKITSWSNSFHSRTIPTGTNITKLTNSNKYFVARGSGRSLSNASFIKDGFTVNTKSLNKIVDFNNDKGTILCQSGVQMFQIYNYLKDTKWALAVAGGTRWVTIGGAIAGDIHGKNHTINGSFGNHILNLKIILANGKEVECSPRKKSDLFRATIGGMGMTGIITEATIKLAIDRKHTFTVTNSPVASVEDAITSLLKDKSEYSVVWLDLLRKDNHGILYSANQSKKTKRFSYPPFTFPIPKIGVFNLYFMRIMNYIRYKYEVGKISTKTSLDSHYQVDILKHWNNLYGPLGFQECQFVVPTSKAIDTINKFLEICQQNNVKPFFCVIKKFGKIRPKGFISFPQPGIAFMADFKANDKNYKIFEPFNDYIIHKSGKVNLTKDFCLTAKQFKKMYPKYSKWAKVLKKYDPKSKIQSDLSIRLNIKTW